MSKPVEYFSGDLIPQKKIEAERIIRDLSHPINKKLFYIVNVLKVHKVKITKYK